MVEIKSLFAGLQTILLAELQVNRKVNEHQGAKGENTEIDWKGLLEKHLPARYSITKGFVVDCNGNTSDQIDIIIHDRQYTPILFYQEDSPYIPAESVYGVFEVKQDLDSDTLQYAAQKAESVRKLHRTSAPVHHIDGTSKPKDPGPIISGILANNSSWSPPLGETLEKHLSELKDLQIIDMGCALEHGSFVYKEGNFKSVEADYSLATFIIRLLQSLQELGTVPAIDWEEYLSKL